MFCFHKYDPEIKDGYQFCSKCGKAKAVECNHVWEILKEQKMVRNYTEHVTEYHMQCKKCGEMKFKTY